MRVLWIIVAAPLVALGGCGRGDASRLDVAVSQYEVAALADQQPDEPRVHAQPRSADGNVAGERTWLCALAEDAGLAPAKKAPAKRPTAPGWGKGKEGELEYVPWRQRVGKAYPGHFWPSLSRMGQEMPETLWDDSKSMVTNRTSLILLGVAGLTGVAIAGSDLDDRVEDHYTKHGSQLGEDMDSLGGFLGNPALHLPGAFVAVLAATASEDEEFYENSTELLNALVVNGLTTQGLKWVFRSASPNGDEMGWPSGHSSSSFCLATVMYHQYGPKVGLPLMGFATFVAYQRVDARNHDFSDVVSGSLIGIAIGHAVASNHEMRVLGMDIVPFVDPDTGSVGVALTKDW